LAPDSRLPAPPVFYYRDIHLRIQFKPHRVGGCLCIAGSGLILGIIWATRTWKKHGTMQFLSRLNATPDLDKKTEKENKKQETRAKN
jgi:hypothetical protein